MAGLPPRAEVRLETRYGRSVPIAAIPNLIHAPPFTIQITKRRKVHTQLSNLTDGHEPSFRFKIMEPGDPAGRSGDRNRAHCGTDHSASIAVAVRRKS